MRRLDTRDALVNLLRFGQHHHHHLSKKDAAYCVLTGLLNPILDGCRFWRALEWVGQSSLLTFALLALASDPYPRLLAHELLNIIRTAGAAARRPARLPAAERVDARPRAGR